MQISSAGYCGVLTLLIRFLSGAAYQYQNNRQNMSQIYVQNINKQLENANNIKA